MLIDLLRKKPWYFQIRCKDKVINYFRVWNTLEQSYKWKINLVSLFCLDSSLMFYSHFAISWSMICLCFCFLVKTFSSTYKKTTAMRAEWNIDLYMCREGGSEAEWQTEDTDRQKFKRLRLIWRQSPKTDSLNQWKF